MPENCLDINLHHSSGTSQQQRMLPALDSGYVKVDERTTADLLLFAKTYGTYLNYHNEKNQLTGDWSSFMSRDISVIIANIQDWGKQGKDYISYINDLYDQIKSAPTPLAAQIHFKYIFDFTFSFIDHINNVLKQLPADSEYSVFLNTAIASKLSVPANQLSTYYTSFITTVLSGLAISNTDPLAPFSELIFVPLAGANFASRFGYIGNDPWKLPLNVIIPPASLFLGDPIADIVTNNFFTGAVTSLLNGIISIVNLTSSFLEKTLNKYPGHEPHYALYLGFIRLFRFAQDHLNLYTQRHLRFYYKDVLQLNNNTGIPDTAHLVFTLQKSTDQHLLTRGTQFKAGKDAANHDIYYSLTDDIVLNQAVVGSLKSLYTIKNFKNGTANIPQQLFASPKANSSDGQGGKLTGTDKSWYPFGDLANSDFVNKSKGNIGFAIASNIFFLNEGVRTVTVTINCDAISNSILAALGASLPPNSISAGFTGNKKWFDSGDYLPDTGSGTTIQTDTTNNQIIITIKLNGNAPPVIPYSQKIHGGFFQQALPMMEIKILDFTYYALIKSLKILTIELKAEVDAIKNLSLQNDAGKLDPTKPFKPFGDFPENKASFIIGSKEIFQKQLTTLTLQFAWQHPLLVPTPVDVLALTEGKWTATGSSDTAVDISGGLLTVSETTNIPQSTPDFTANESCSNVSINGFIKLQLDTPSNDYSLATYLANMAAAKITVVTQPGSGTNETDYTVTPPTPPPAVQLMSAQSMTVGYSAYKKIAFDQSSPDQFNRRSDFFYHIEPFGFREMHPFLLKIPIETDATLSDNIMHLLPVFNMDNDLSDSSDNGSLSGHNNEGELWIGLSSPKTGETHSVLFQVSEGSSNPLKNITKIRWFYLSSNNWILLDPVTQVNDQTNSLSESGLIIFNLPGDETFHNTRADDQLLWIKGVVKNNTDSICKLITIQSNAAKAGFVSDTADKIFFTNHIAANTITKPAVADAALKQTSQPYPSFDGVPQETDPQFHQRVSERLRHKHRAVTSWDYERLILQYFPQIHKVKCLNHTHLNATTQDYNEMKPGDVMIVTIPDLRLLTGANPLLPFTNVGLLEDIKKFVKKLCTPFVHLHVCNPQFEAVQFVFNVYFINNNSNSSYFTEQLNADIQKFLMPWAFGSSTQDIEFGGKIEKSVVLNFVQTRPYVDFVTCFKMLKYTYREDGTYSSPTADADEAIASTARSVLVPYSYHSISPTATCTCNG
jgi:hypothetical protein